MAARRRRSSAPRRATVGKPPAPPAPGSRRRRPFDAAPPAPPKPAWSTAGLPALVDLYLADLAAQNTRPKTRRTYRGALLRMAPLLVNATSAAELLRELGKLRPATRALYLSTARNFELWAVSGGHRPRPLFVDRVRVKLDDAAPRPLDAATLAKLDAATSHVDRRLRLLWLLLRWTGVRIGEALALRWRDVELGAGREGLTLRTTKGRADRHVPLMPGPLLAELRRRKLEGDRPVFGGGIYDDSRPWSYRAALVAWGGLCRRAGVTAVPHQMRHTRATELHRKGLSASELQRAMGWRKLEHAARYVRVTDEDLRGALKRAERGRDDEG
jgi:integrase